MVPDQINKPVDPKIPWSRGQAAKRLENKDYPGNSPLVARAGGEAVRLPSETGIVFKSVPVSDGRA